MIRGYMVQDRKAGRAIIIRDDYITWEDGMEMLAKSRVCFRWNHGMTCAKHNDNKFSFNRKDNSIGHTKHNCQPMCLKCNRELSNKCLDT